MDFLIKFTFKKTREFIRVIAIFILVTILVGCATASSLYSPILTVVRAPNVSDQVEYLVTSPSRASLCLGVIKSNGNGFASFDTLIANAKKKSAKIGADYILYENSGVENSVIYSPGSSSY